LFVEVIPVADCPEVGVRVDTSADVKVFRVGPPTRTLVVPAVGTVVVLYTATAL
jgi:hypothetical protein